MAEKSSELDRVNASDAISTTIGGDQEEYLEARSDDYATDEYTTSGTETLEAATDEAETTDDTDQIRAQIEETRSQMGETIDAIQEKLSFQNISEQVKEQVSEQINSALETAKDTVYSATIGNLGKAGKFMQNIGREISKTDAGKFARKNPFPLVLIGLGVGLLAYEGFGRSNRRSYRYTDRYSDYDVDNRQYGGRESATINTLKSATGKIGDTASNALGTVSETTGQALESVKGAASSAYGTVTDTANKAYESVTDYAGTAYEKVGEYGGVAREKYDYYLEENPLAVGAVALAVGAAVGLAIPASRYESELMGDYSQQILDRAQTAAGDLVDRVKEVASEAQKTLGDEVKTTLSETKKTIADEAKNQGFISESDKTAGFNTGKNKNQGLA